MTKITGFTREELEAIVQAVEERLDRLEEDGDESFMDEKLALYAAEQKMQAAIAQAEVEQRGL